MTGAENGAESVSSIVIVYGYELYVYGPAYWHTSTAIVRYRPLTILRMTLSVIITLTDVVGPDGST